MCSGQQHCTECFCTILKHFYGDAIWKCGRPGCSFFRTGFMTKARRDRHMQAHSRPYKCDQEGCTFVQLGFPTQSHLRIHHQQYHSQKAVKPRARKYKKTKRQELKLILMDAIKEDDLQTVRDIWDRAKSFRTVLLLTAIQEKSSQSIIDFLIERMDLERIPRARKERDIFNILQAATETFNVSVFKAINLQDLAWSYGGEQIMIKISQQVAIRRNADLVAQIAPQIPPVFTGFIEVLIPYKPNEEAEANALECLKRIRHTSVYKNNITDHLRALGARCCSIPIAQLLIEDGAVVNERRSTAHSALYAASRSSDEYAAAFMKFLLDSGANPDDYHKKQPISSRPAARTIHRWLGMTWEEVASKYLEANSKSGGARSAQEDTDG